MNDSDYKNNVGCIAAQPEHLEIATKMANEITGNDAFKQNEMIELILRIVRERREQDLNEAEKKFIYLRDSYQRMVLVQPQ